MRGGRVDLACPECGREDHPYGAHRCARCILRERLTEVLTDPATGQIHARLAPVFEELVNSGRPQTGIWWLRKKPGPGPRLLGQMARGEVAISHDTFRALPSDRAHDYLRSLLVAVKVLPPFEIQIERMLPYIEQAVADLPADQTALIRRFAHWHVLRGMRKAAREDRLTQAITNASRRRIRVAIDFMAFLDTHGANPATATQDLMERYQEHVDHRGKSLYASRDTGWLFPGGNPGRHLATENIRAQLVATGIKPYENRKATLFQLAGDIPAPVLAELIGITNDNAAAWARLAARDWTGYIAERAR